MTTILTTPVFIKGIVDIRVFVNDQAVIPDRNGFVGILEAGTKLRIEVDVDGMSNHECYTLNSKKERVVKPRYTEIGVETYVKHFTVQGRGTALRLGSIISRILGLMINETDYNIGFFNRGRKFYFAMVERKRLEADENTLVGTVLAANVLNGTAVVFSGNPLMDLKVHWTAMPWRKNLGYGFVVPGELLLFSKEDVVPAHGNTGFSHEIMSCRVSE